MPLDIHSILCYTVRGDRRVQRDDRGYTTDKLLREVFMKFNNKSLLRYLYEIGVLLLGNAGVAFLVAAFVIPHNIIMGGGSQILLKLAANKKYGAFGAGQKILCCHGGKLTALSRLFGDLPAHGLGGQHHRQYAPGDAVCRRYAWRSAGHCHAYRRLIGWRGRIVLGHA